MSRPTVLVATTNSAMAYALQASLKENCRSLGLKLEICPDGDESDIGKDVRTYDSSEVLFDALEKRDPMELADTLVVLDVGAELNNAFSPAAIKDERWHVTKNRAGIAVELLLRFPHVFPVFLSPSVPVSSEKDKVFSDEKQPRQANHNEHETSKVASVTNNEWKGFRSQLKNLNTQNKPYTDDDKWNSLTSSLMQLYGALQFVSPLDAGKDLNSSLEFFARGMRCWFDPTGLRTLVRNYFLGTLFGSNNDWSNTRCKNDKAPQLRDALLTRLGQETIAIDEEREFALLSAYTSWKYGRRAWMVTTYGEFNKGLWVTKHGENPRNVIVLRDVDVRFPDISNVQQVKREEQVEQLEVRSIREQLKDVGSPLEWKKNIDATWYVRAISGDANIKEDLDAANRVGQDPVEIQPNGSAKYYGFRKPIGSLYELKSVLGKEAGDAVHSLQSCISAADDSKGGGGHGAPYSNLAMAEALLRYSSVCKESPSAHLIGALLAMESYELLLGMSKTTALEALLAVHKHEVMAEVSFPGVSHTVDIEERKKDVEATLDSLYKDNASVGEPKNFKQKKGSERVKKIYLSQFWSELRIQYHDGEQFDAAEKANIQSLINSHDWLKMWMLHPATSIIWWLWYALGSSFIFALGYGWLSTNVSFQVCWPECLINFLDIWWQVVMAMLQVQLGDNDQIVTASKSGSEFGLHIVELLHMGVSYLLLGLLISMLYRKITRS